MLSADCSGYGEGGEKGRLIIEKPVPAFEKGGQTEKMSRVGSSLSSHNRRRGEKKGKGGQRPLPLSRLHKRGGRNLVDRPREGEKKAARFSISRNTCSRLRRERGEKKEGRPGSLVNSVNRGDAPRGISPSPSLSCTFRSTLEGRGEKRTHICWRPASEAGRGTKRGGGGGDSFRQGSGYCASLLDPTLNRRG